MLKPSMQNVYEILSPERITVPLVFDSPHSGSIYPADFRYDCAFEVLQQAEDNEVDTLYESIPTQGGVMLRALFPRTYIDVNRAETDIDTVILEEPWPYEHNETERSRSGVGLIRRPAAPDTPVYNRKLTVKEIEQRIEKFYKPYHQAIRHLLDDTYECFRQVWHINCHSMPSRIFALPFDAKDFVLGDHSGTSCDPDLTRAVRDFLKDLGYRVAINDPYKGAELTSAYAAPNEGRHSLQIEINKALYWDENEAKRNNNYNKLKEDIEKLVCFLTDYTENKLDNPAPDC